MNHQNLKVQKEDKNNNLKNINMNQRNLQKKNNLQQKMIMNLLYHKKFL